MASSGSRQSGTRRHRANGSQTEQLDVFIPPAGMSPTGGATTVDTTARARSGRRRRTARCGSIPTPGQFTEFKSITYKTRTAPA